MRCASPPRPSSGVTGIARGEQARAATLGLLLTLLVVPACRSAGGGGSGSADDEQALDELPGELAYRAPAGLLRGLADDTGVLERDGEHVTVHLEGRRFEPPRVVTPIPRAEALYHRPEVAYVAATSALAAGDAEWMATCVAPERRADVRQAGSPVVQGGGLGFDGEGEVRIRAVVEHGDRAWVLLSRLEPDGELRRAVGMRRSGDRWVLHQDRRNPVEVVVSRGYERGDWGRQLSRRPR